jgi:arylsulfatase A-like enzyme
MLYPDVRTLAERLSDSGLTTLGVVQTPYLDPVYGFDRGFDTYNSARSGRRRRAAGAVRVALKLVDTHLDEPFFLFLHLIDPHLKYDPPKSAAGRFTNDIDAGLKLPVGNTIELRRAYPGYSPVKKEFVEAAYDEEILFVDQQIARFLEGLKSRGLEDSTLVVLTADHGEEFFEHSGFEHGHSMYEEVLRVPFMVWGPGVTPGRESLPVSIADAAPTILEALDLEIPDAGFGRSLWPVIAENQAGHKDRLIVAAGTFSGAEQRMAMRWPYKLVQQPEAGKLALFNLADDPEEKNDLIESHGEIARELARELDLRMHSIENGPPRKGVELDAEMIEDLRELGYVE